MLSRQHTFRLRTRNLAKLILRARALWCSSGHISGANDRATADQSSTTAATGGDDVRDIQGAPDRVATILGEADGLQSSIPPDKRRRVKGLAAKLSSWRRVQFLPTLAPSGDIIVGKMCRVSAISDRYQHSACATLLCWRCLHLGGHGALPSRLGLEFHTSYPCSRAFPSGMR